MLVVLIVLAIFAFVVMLIALALCKMLDSIDHDV